MNNDSKERCLQVCDLQDNGLALSQYGDGFVFNRQAIAESQGFHFMVLFKDGLKFRGLYMHNPENEQVQIFFSLSFFSLHAPCSFVSSLLFQSYKIYGIGPKVITSKMVDCVYK